MTVWVPDTSIYRGKLYEHPATGELCVVERTPSCASRHEDLRVELRSLVDLRAIVVPHDEFVGRWPLAPWPKHRETHDRMLERCAKELEAMSGYAPGIVRVSMLQVAKSLRVLVPSPGDERGEDPSRLRVPGVR